MTDENNSCLESNTTCPTCDKTVSCVCTECKWWYCPDHILDFHNHVNGGHGGFCVVEDCYKHQTKIGSKFCEVHN